MTNLFKFTAGSALALALAAQPALAQTKQAAVPAPAAAARGPAVAGMAIANLEAAVANSAAYKNAETQRLTAYKATYDAVQARATQIDAQLKQLAAKFNADNAARLPEATLQADGQAFQTAQERGKQEVQQIAAPISLSQAYVEETISDKLGQAVQNAMQKRGVTILLRSETVLAREGGYELTPAIIAELNLLVPSVPVVPPQGWLPRQMREQQAQQQGQTVPRPATAPGAVKPATKQPEGR